jgi:hypothetical protein
MSQRINVRAADARRGSQAFVAIIAVLLLAGAGFGGWYWYSTRPAKGDGPVKRDADKQAATIYSNFTDSLNEIAGEPAKVDEELLSIKKLSDTDVETLKTDFAAANEEMKKKVLKIKTDEEPKLTEAWGKAMANADVKAKLEPTAKTLKDKLDAIK